MSSIALPPEQEQAWLESLRADLPYGLHHIGAQSWLIMQPSLFYGQRKNLLNGRLVVGRLEASREHSVLSLAGLPMIDNLGVSRIHAAIMPLEHGLVIEDIGSTNGTRINGLKLVAGRSYNLNHQDLLEIGHLRLFIHFIEMDIFVKGIRALLLRQFSAEVQAELAELVAPGEALMVLLNRLPKRPEAQLQVLWAFKAQNEPLTLEKLHERINKVIGDSPLVEEAAANLAGERTGEMGPEILQQLSTHRLTAEVPGDELGDEGAKSTYRIPKKGLASQAFHDWAALLHQQGLQMEGQLEALLAKAQALESQSEREEATRLVTSLLIQVAAWRPTVRSHLPSSDS
jgi:pSer/pThr/pTyr-binding forkhead associated (FHA) protein